MIQRLIIASLVCVAASTGAIGLAPVALADRPYANCTEAHDDGRWDIPQGDPAYWDGRDGDSGMTAGS